MLYRLADAAGTKVVWRDGGERTVAGAFLDAATSREVFERTGSVARIEVDVPASGAAPMSDATQAATGAPGRVDALLARMTLAEKIGQMTQADESFLED